ncbi:CHAP domain-containing protein [Macrococcus lamae]|uniref:CHAP domain-containing protein n=1 Tax=Macrococcus lamae TaxID=198484 RepID=A0A4R6BW03_9STAP|nr:CHAP domain-containing protein [Macrococcus lamae]TDM12602.1 CHAP domain-containing protein [Macrococcus lamae]
MKKIILTLLTLIVLFTIADELHVSPIKVSNEAEAAVYRNPIKYKAANYYSWGSCVYYAFNRRAQMGRYVSNRWGNARNWATNAARSGYTVRRKPVYGSVMVSKSGYYGHVAVVERVYKNGNILVSEMNFPRQGVKTYRTVYRSNVSSYQYIY